MTAIRPGSVTFENVSKKFGSFTALPDLSLTVEPGTLVTLLGPSGCGKTTTLRLLAGLEHPTSGRILIGGKDVTNLPANERDVSMVFQSYALFPHMSSLDNVAYGLESSGYKKKEARDRAEEGLKLVGLAGMGHRLPRNSQAGNNSVWLWLVLWCWNRRFCFWMNRFPILMRDFAEGCERKFENCSNVLVLQRSMLRTIRTKRWLCQIPSS